MLTGSDFDSRHLPGVGRLLPSLLILRIRPRWTSEEPPADRSELRNTIHVVPLAVPLSNDNTTSPRPHATPAESPDSASAGDGAGLPTGTTRRDNPRGTTPPPLALDSDSTSTTTAMYYGTRLSTVVLIRRDGNATFIERDIWALEQQQERQRTSDGARASRSDSDSDSDSDSHSGADGGGGAQMQAEHKHKHKHKPEFKPKPVDKRDSGGRDHDRVFRFQIPIPSAR